MALDKTEFLRFNAYSMKDLITRKLSENSKFTDQIYEGSNLAILIDLVSYMYQCLMYQLNNAASESMFADTLIYENIIRLCKFIGYHPKGFRPAKLDVYVAETGLVDNVEIRQRYVPSGARINTGLFDTHGKPIYFSTDYEIFSTNGEKLLSKSAQQIGNDSVVYTAIHMINGLWKIYPTVFTATGDDYETFFLSGVKSDSASNKYVADNSIKVFVQGKDGSLQYWDCDPNELFVLAYNSSDTSNANMSKLYGPDSNVYSLYMNEDKEYSIKFGNGVTGKKLKAGDKIYVIYLETNGMDGYVDVSNLDLSNVKFEHNANMFGVSQEIYQKIFRVDDVTDLITDSDYDKAYTLEVNYDSLTKPISEEGVEDIRTNAPQWFKTGNRLITKKDYEYFFRSVYASDIVDVKCMNNWDYMTTFYRWMYNLGLVLSRGWDEYVKNNGVDFEKSGTKYLNSLRISQSGYQYVDSADGNNIYLWILSNSNSGDATGEKYKYDTTIQNIKTMTSETYPLNPIQVHFDISFTPPELYIENIGNIASDAKRSYLEITMNDNSIFSNTAIVNKVYDIIIDYFDVSNCRLGQTVKYGDILNNIYAINGVERVRTVFFPLNSNELETYSSRHCDGIAFASWTNAQDLIPDVGVDLEVGNTTRQMELFQFPVYSEAAKSNLMSKIKVIKKSMNTTNPVRF